LRFGATSQKNLDERKKKSAGWNDRKACPLADSTRRIKIETVYGRKNDLA
jgi:hypothetical protein